MGDVPGRLKEEQQQLEVGLCSVLFKASFAVLQNSQQAVDVFQVEGAAAVATVTTTAV